MSKKLMDNLIMEDKISKIVGPIAVVYLCWLFIMAMIDFKVFMTALIIQTIVIALIGIIDPLINRRVKSSVS
ncbi:MULTISPECIES: hypothetical protein [Lactobacillus]|uniref:Uncharacterized protein n=1 Tax=Lactobacillus xujianguonis TaxID=2495899 RepID=A0A437STU4_9LACO|nr:MULTISPECIES: hypothetical protein [Lactobacillus]RVU70338.1 hypothetical protein EJK17_08160 [Lactobacillus xujianguonis]RVU76881.1 hypothetical protein EJK20_03630 [Lactobacillus xujianguonis]